MLRSIQNQIYEVRGVRIILDRHLAELYEVPLKTLNLAVKRNLKRFPDDFMFRLTNEEYDSLRFQFETLKKIGSDNQSIKRGRGQHTKYLPYAFTEQGVAMLSGLINSRKSISMNYHNGTPNNENAAQ